MTRLTQIKRKLLVLGTQFLVVALALLAHGGDRPEINLMAPLFIGDLNNPDFNSQERAWSELREQLKIAKSVGVNAITTDIWWGLVENGNPGEYNWQFYDRLVQIIKDENLRWVPILSFHQLGGNVGDVGFIPIPKYVWGRYSKDLNNFPDERALMFKSEQGNFSKEYVSFWATPVILDDLTRFMANFRDHFRGYSDIVDEINISLGPSGELRYPSYNQHDNQVGYPSRGAIQSYSAPAIQGFRVAMKEKYGNIGNLKKSWGFDINSFEQIFPPNPWLLKDRFWLNGEHFSPYGKDFFDYYNEVLVRHGQLMLESAQSVFGASGSSFQKISIGGKIPGIHWHLSSDRSAELSAGLIRTSYNNWTAVENGFGYGDTLRVFETKPGDMTRVLTFTAVEMSDNRDDNIGANSRAKTLVGWIAQAAHSRHIEIEGENALGSELNNADAWKNISEAITKNQYRKITLLRLNEIANDAHRLQMLREFHAQMQARKLSCSRSLGGDSYGERTSQP